MFYAREESGWVKAAELAFEELLVSGETGPGVRINSSFKSHLEEESSCLRVPG